MQKHTLRCAQLRSSVLEKDGKLPASSFACVVDLQSRQKSILRFASSVVVTSCALRALVCVKIEETQLGKVTFSTRKRLFSRRVAAEHKKAASVSHQTPAAHHTAQRNALSLDSILSISLSFLFVEWHGMYVWHTQTVTRLWNGQRGRTYTTPKTSNSSKAQSILRVTTSKFPFRRTHNDRSVV